MSDPSSILPSATLPSALPSDGDTIAELRELYRSAEARSARLRLLSVSGRELAEAGPDDLEPVLSRCADRLAFFSGKRAATLVLAQSGAGRAQPRIAQGGISIHAPGLGGVIVATLMIDGLESLEAIPDSEDREAFRMHLELMGATIDRIYKERERAQLLAKLKAREKSLELLLEKVFTAQEEERRRVSHELHDGVAQTATALVRLLEGAQANSAQANIAQAASGGPAPTEVARGLVSELRRVIAGMRPTLLDDLGLIAAIQSLGEDLEKAGYGVTMRLNGGSTRLAPLMEAALFRVAQEAVSNIHKHAGGPCLVLIEAQLGADEIILRITDEGRGPSQETLCAGLLPGHNVGIEVMKERMTALGGTLDWRAGDNRGVVVEARIPTKSALSLGDAL